jgi:hypothetical protein
MAVLGLLPPYAFEDVQEAYRQKVMAVHPDRGGDPVEFIKVSDAYDKAVEYVKSGGNRRVWIAAQVERHLLQEEVSEEVRRLGGKVEFESIDWVGQYWGEGFSDFAHRLRCIRVRGLTDGDKFLEFLSKRRPPYLIGLDIAESKLTDAGLAYLAGCEILHWLDLARTGVTYHGLRPVLDRLVHLQWINVRGTRLSWWGQWLLARKYRQVHFAAADTDTPPGA